MCAPEKRRELLLYVESPKPLHAFPRIYSHSDPPEFLNTDTFGF